jgi:homopolymeric O-antigen transport system permease protein
MNLARSHDGNSADFNRRVVSTPSTCDGATVNAPAPDHQSRTRRFSSRQAFVDIGAALERHELWRTLGWADIKFRYRRTVLGPFWLTLSTGTMVFAIGLLYAGLFHQDVSSYLPSLAIGIIIWNFFSVSLTEGCAVFIGAAGFIKAYTIPLPIYVFRLIWRNVFIFLHNFVIVLLVWALFRWTISPIALLCVLGYAVIVVFISGLVMFFGVLCTRFRDIPQIVASVVQLFFFITPIMWSPDALGDRRWIALVNPMFSFIELVRAPLLNQAPEGQEWLIAICCALASVVVGMAFYARYGYRVAYWL